MEAQPLQSNNGTQVPALRPFPIKDALLDRVFSHGVASLSDVEILALLIRSGDAQMTALDVAHNVALRCDNSLLSLAKYTPWELAAMPGMGRSKAAMITVAMELGRRRAGMYPNERPLIHDSHTGYEVLKTVLADLQHEEFYVLLLDRGNRLITRERISSGGMHGTVADPKIIFRLALERRASSIILAHNHPSGQLRPSAEDITLTKKLVEGGRFMDITVQDHLIVSQSGYYSFADNGQLG
ncbi:MAG TPA: DNA repair protein RadC [Flavobacteriales bacterium]|nr:DNA repair protein RadC [Flavobacteriales bacterium]